MNTRRWKKPRWLPTFLAMPVPEPAQQASTILSIQRNIILPARVMVIMVVCYYLFYGHRQLIESPSWGIVLETLQTYSIFYIVINAIAAGLLIQKRFPPRLVQWVVFAVGLVDGVLLAGLTLETGGFSSTLFWVFPGLIMVNALSIPLATPQIVLNLALSAFYLGSGLLYITVSENDSALWHTTALPHHLGIARFASTDILDVKSMAGKLNQGQKETGVFNFVYTNLSTETRGLLQTGPTENTNQLLLQALAEDFNRITTNNSIYDVHLFSKVHLSPDTIKMISDGQPTNDTVRLNRKLLQDLFVHEMVKRKLNLAVEEARFSMQPIVDGVAQDNSTEPFVLRLIILWLVTASCYGVQLLLFRQRISEEEERKASARNDELKAAGRLAAEIAHQLKNPLAIINNAIYSLEKGLNEGRDSHDLQLTIIREEIERSDRILTQLMGYAQLSEGRVERLNLIEEFERAVAEVLPHGSEYETRIDRDFSAKLPELLMQRNHLSVVLVNLMQNAREAMDGRGAIKLSAHYGDNSTLHIAVGDTGPGIAFERLDKIFEAYYSTKDKGTGLGLAIVKHNVELYGGEVRVESELGKGSRFILIFPSKTFIVSDS